MTTTRRLAAILAADVAGYSAAMERDEEGTAAAVRALRREVIEPKLIEHHGRLIKTTGDGFLAEFASPIAALKCALAIQQRPEESGGLRLRIGLNLGDVIIEEGGDVLGEGVNIAARLEGLAEPGGILISSKIYSEVDGKVHATFEDRGEQQVKNISKPVRTYAVWNGTRARAALHEPGKPLPLPDKPSIAVLPFQNMSGDPEQEYFADGMVEEIITALSRTKQLFVIARNSSFTFKGRAVDIKEVARALGVHYVLEGSVRKSGNRIRITGQLIDATTGSHLWVDKFDGALEDVFDLQDKVASSVAGAIVPSITAAEMDWAKRKPTDSLDAYDQFLRAQASHWLFSSEAIGEAIRLYEQAIAADPEFVPAISGLGSAFNLRRTSGWSQDPTGDLTRSLTYTRMAMRMAPHDPTILGRSAVVFLSAGDVELAETLAEQAHRLDPNEMNAFLWGGFAKLFLGNHRAAQHHFQQALRLNPIDPRGFFAHTGLAFAHFFLGEYAKGCENALQALRDHPDALIGLRSAIACNAYAGNLAAAREFYRRLALLAPSERVSDLRARNAYRREQDHLKLEDAFRRAGMPE